MPKTSQEQTGSAYPRTNSKHWIGVEAEDIPQGWMDDMVKRLFDVMNRNLIRLETAQIKKSDDPEQLAQVLKETAQQARLAAQLRADMERLRDLEMKRVAEKPKVMVSDDEARAELQRRLDRLVAGGEAAKDPE